MAGLVRVQQRFNAAIVTLLTLAGFGRLAGENAKDEAAKGHGHPIHAKYLKGKLDGCPAGLHLTHRTSCAHHASKL